jgi:hypothetical protein
MSKVLRVGMLQIPLFKELICYVCRKPVRENDSIGIGGGLKRHIKCKPGSRRWQKYQLHASKPTEK